MPKKSILIVNNNMEIGGIQKALVNLLREIGSQYDVTLFLFHKHGELLKDVPDSVKIVEANPLLSLLGVSYEQSKGMGHLYFLIRTGLSLFSKLFGNRVPIACLVHTAKRIGSFDVAISYMQNSAKKMFYGGCNEFVFKKTIAHKKISFLHCDFENYEGNDAHNRNIYEKFDRIIAVSFGCQASFLKVMPHLKEKTRCVHNCYDFEQIKNLSNQKTMIYDNHYFNIVTVARLAPEKGIVRCLDIMKRFHQEGIALRWHIVGDGPMRDEIHQYIAKEKMKDVIILYGKQDNPYRYIKNADFLLLPSYHEAAPMVFHEAAILGVPVLSTKTSSAVELVENENIGWVCENDEKSIYKMLKELLLHPEMIQDKKASLNVSTNNGAAIHELKRTIF